MMTNIVRAKNHTYMSAFNNDAITAKLRLAVISFYLLIIITILPGTLAADNHVVTNKATETPASKVSTAWTAYIKNVDDCNFDVAYMGTSQMNSILAKWNGDHDIGMPLPDKDQATKHLANIIKLRHADENIKLKEWTEASKILNGLLKSDTHITIYDSTLYSHALSMLKTVNENISKEWDKRIAEANTFLELGESEKAKNLFKDEKLKRDSAPEAVRFKIDDVILRADKMEVIRSLENYYVMAIRILHGFAKDILIVPVVIFAFVILSFIQWVWFMMFQALLSYRQSHNIWKNKFISFLESFLRWLAPKTLSTWIIEINYLSSGETEESKKTIENRKLGDRLAQAIDSLCAGHYHYSDEAEALTISEDDQPSTKAVTTSIQTEVAMTTSTPLNLGVITLNITPLHNWLQSLISTKRYATRFEGTLRIIHGVDEKIAYELFLRRRGLCSPDHYYAYINEIDIDEKTSDKFERVFDHLIKEIAFQIAATTKGCVTHNAKSLQHYYEGMSKLEQQIENATSHTNFDEAVKYFHKSLSFDPDNWLARYYLGYALRRLEKHLDAAAQFLLIKDKINSPFDKNQASTGHKHLHDYNDKYKLLPFFLQWQADYSRSLSDDLTTLDNAVKDLVALITELVPKTKFSDINKGGFHNPGPCRLLWLCHAAKVVACANIYTLVVEEQKYNAILEAWAVFNADGDTGCKLPWDVKSMAQTAYASALYKHGKIDAQTVKIANAKKAIEILWEAVNKQSGFEESMPYEMLITIYLDMKNEVSVKWENKSNLCLSMLETIIPGNEKLFLLKSRIFYETEKYEKAENQIKSAGNTKEALELKAKIESKRPKTPITQYEKVIIEYVIN